MRYTVVINGRGRLPHAACWEDFAQALVAVLRRLGHEVVQLDDPVGPGRLIMFGANNTHDSHGLMPPDAICFNTEQAAAVSDPRVLMQGFAGYKGRVVWDYSKANVEALKGIGIARAIHCPVGYDPSMERVTCAPIPYECVPAPCDDKDVDVLFYGAVNERRKRILDELASNPDGSVRWLVQAVGTATIRTSEGRLCVVHLHGVYGEERDRWIARSKVVLNLRFYPRSVFEIFRVSHLLANRACVVSEDGGVDPELEAFAKVATRCVPREEIVETCRQLVVDEGARRLQVERGYQAFARTSLVENVRLAIERS